MLLLLVLADSTYDCLYQIYAQTNGDNWADNTNWAGEDYCYYAHVKCTDGVVVYLDFTSNKMAGELPECVSELYLTSLVLYDNQLSGKVPEIPNALYTLDLRKNKFSAWPEHLSAGQLNNLRATSNSFVLFHPELFYIATVDVSGLGMRQETPITVEITSNSLKMAYNNLQNITISSVRAASTIDLTNTGIYSVALDLSTVKISTFNAGGTNLTLSNPYVKGASVVDISGGRARFTFYDPGVTCKIFALRNMYLSGYAPTTQQIDELIGESDLSYDVSGSVFLCDGDANNAGECYFAVIDSAVQENGVITVKITSRLYLEPISADILLAIKNESQSSAADVHTDIYGLTGYAQDDDQITLEFKALTYFGPLSNYNIALLYQDKQFSDNSVHVYEEIKKMLANTTHDSFTRNSSAFTPYSVENKKKYSIIVTGMSQCPYYTDYINSYVHPFYYKYAAIAQHIHYDFVCFSSVKEGYYTYASSLHGQYESFTDAALVCARDKADDFLYVQFYHCFTETIEARKCVRAYFDEGVARDIFQCMGDEYIQLFAADQQRTEQLDSHASPTLFLQREGEEPFYVDDIFLNVDGFKRVICKHFADIAECNE